ncbi:MAG: bifunctional heptose 7-phosphate kinase/heptose 1-phosphate adenyltransferase [Alphaproteobacteria bacterium RIFOXYD12_FULL_60_8]|nr:MAG: bifunctional heptose 7-phosphate kinase/heptose 1-phosphate adenyltransferase [Alphaproteobacteria bacterium RIFOXYD12_FULL_60_8]
MTDQSVLAEDVGTLKGSRVLCLGDVMLDRFIYGEVERISPEAPIPVVRITREQSMLGGAGNVVANLTALGATPIFATVVGDDGVGADVATLLKAMSGVQPRLTVDPGRRTTKKTRYFAGSQQLLRADNETVAPISREAETALLKTVAEALPQSAVVVLSDYGKGVLTPHVVSQAIALALAAGKPVIVDPKGTDYTRYRGAMLLTPNRKELHDATRMSAATDAEVEAAARHLVTACGVGAVLATRSQDGMTLLDRDGRVSHLSAEAREVFDVSGAGDTVVATMAAAVGAGVSLLDASRLANVAAGIVVGKVGTAVVTTQELVHALHHQEFASSETKVMTLPEAITKVEQWRRRGCKVGFTNGCFDLLHPGHIALLRQAAAACDRLVLGLNSDASVRALKGPTRPVQSESARATVLASLEAVNAVVIFGEDTPRELIHALKPDVLVKGADYTVETVVGADFVQGYGGRVVLAKLEEGHSTTNTLKRLGKE